MDSNETDDEIRAILDAHSYDETKPPEPSYEEAEFKYREGYRDGMYEAVRLMVEFKRAGYQRTSDIANIIGDHVMGDVRQWMRRGHTLNHERPPILAVNAWPELREQVFARDGRVCCLCSATEDLSIDHIEPVKDGGLPTLNNLRVLCRSCNSERNGGT